MKNNNEETKCNSFEKLLVSVAIVMVAILIIVTGYQYFKDSYQKEETTNDKTTKTKIEYKIVNIDDNDADQKLLVNGNEVPIDSIAPITFENVEVIEDIVIADVSDPDFSTLYAISSEGEILWYIRDKYICDLEKDSKCISVIGDSYSKTLGYDDKYFKIDGKKITFERELSSQDPDYTACVTKDTDTYAVEYEIEYLGNNKFSKIKEINKLSTKDYIKEHKIECSWNINF